MRTLSLLAGLVVLFPPLVAMAAPEVSAPEAFASAAPASQPASQPVAASRPAPPLEVSVFTQMWDAFKAGDLREGFAVLITLIVFLWRRYKVLFVEKIPARFLPLIAAGIAFLGSLPVGLTASPFDWRSFIWHSVIAGAEAIALWSILGKFILKFPGKTEG